MCICFIITTVVFIYFPLVEEEMIVDHLTNLSSPTDVTTIHLLPQSTWLVPVETRGRNHQIVDPSQTVCNNIHQICNSIILYNIIFHIQKHPPIPANLKNLVQDLPAKIRCHRLA